MEGRKLKKVISTAFMVLMFACFSASALAEERAKEGNWDFNLAPLYIWMVNMEGDFGIAKADLPVDVDFGTLFDNLESIFTVHFEAMHRSNWGFFFDYSGLDTSASGALVAPPVTITIDFTSTLIEAGGEYRIKNGPHTFDMLGGVRYTKLEPDLTITPPGGKRGLSEDWYDPIIGLRYFYNFGNKWMLSARGDIGGFGVGCDFTWNVAALVHFQPWKNLAFIGGYRVLDQDYESGSGPSRFKYDMRLAGPVLGLNFVW